MTLPYSETTSWETVSPFRTINWMDPVTTSSDVYDPLLGKRSKLMLILILISANLGIFTPKSSYRNSEGIKSVCFGYPLLVAKSPLSLNSLKPAFDATSNAHPQNTRACRTAFHHLIDGDQCSGNPLLNRYPSRNCRAIRALRNQAGRVWTTLRQQSAGVVVVLSIMTA